MELMRIPRTGNYLDMAEAVQDNYTYQVRHFIKWARSNGMNLDEKSIQAYFEFLNSSGYTAATIRNKRSAVKRRVRQVFHDAPVDARIKIERILSDLDHDTETKAPKINSNVVALEKVVGASDFTRLIESCRTERQRSFIKFLYATGCRVSEMAGIRLERCETIGATVKIRIMGKGKKERFIRVQSSMFDAIREVFNGKEYLFETATGRPYAREYVSAQVKKMGKRCGLDISAHSLRHSFATRKVQQLPGKLDAVSKYLGHSSPAITLAMYCHSQLSDVELFDEAVGL